MNREQPHNFEPNDELLSFLSDYCEFGANRVYILSAIARPKENETISHNSIPMFREIITREDKLRQKFAKLQTMADYYTPDEGDNPLTFRLYITANARDVEKSFFQFQKHLIDAQKGISSGHTETRENIKRLDKEWESTLQTDGNKEDNYFIIDIDEKDIDLLNTTIESLKEETTINTMIESPNGFHIITDPFNYPAWDGQDNGEIEIKTDGLMFLTFL